MNKRHGVRTAVNQEDGLPWQTHWTSCWPAHKECSRPSTHPANHFQGAVCPTHVQSNPNIRAVFVRQRGVTCVWRVVICVSQTERRKNDKPCDERFGCRKSGCASLWDDAPDGASCRGRHQSRPWWRQAASQASLRVTSLLVVVVVVFVLKRNRQTQKRQSKKKRLGDEKKQGRVAVFCFLLLKPFQFKTLKMGNCVKCYGNSFVKCFEGSPSPSVHGEESINGVLHLLYVCAILCQRETVP